VVSRELLGEALRQITRETSLQQWSRWHYRDNRSAPPDPERPFVRASGIGEMKGSCTNGNDAARADFGGYFNTRARSSAGWPRAA